MSTTTTTTTAVANASLNASSKNQPSTPDLSTPQAIRHACRTGAHTTPTPGLASGHLQANLLVLPQKYASDFRLLCARNPVPCPLLAESATPGCWGKLRSCVPGLRDDAFVSGDFDIRTDLPAYNTYRDGELVAQGCSHIRDYWRDGSHGGQASVAFLIGCSFSFETALAAAGLPPRHVLHGRNVPMYRTTIPLNPAGVFTGGTYVVSMRPYPAREIERVRDITRDFGLTHGEPIAWGWDAVARLGIGDLERPEWGGAPTFADEGEEVPVFWGCGVTPQEAVMRAGERLEGTVRAHQPGHMLVLDARDEDVKGS